MKSRLNRLALLLVPAVAAVAAVAMQVAVAAPGPVLTELMSKELGDISGKELLAITVDYAPGASDPVHRHDAHVFVYVLEGALTMGVRGGAEVTLTKGQTFYEGPGDIHTVSRNASSTKPAKFLVVFLKNKGADPLLSVR